MTRSNDWFPDKPQARITSVEEAKIAGLQRAVDRLRAALKPFAALASESFVMQCYDENAKLILRPEGRPDLARSQVEVFARDALAALYAFNETNPKPGKSEWQ
jgi:hypothetical protein